MSFKKDKRQETFIYLALWSMLFIAPVISLYIRTINNADADMKFNWSEVFMIWQKYAVFFVIFLVHNHLLAPLLVYRRRKVLYFSIVGALVAGFTVYQCSNHPRFNEKRIGPPREMADKTWGPHPRDFDIPDGEDDGQMMPPDEFRGAPDDDMLVDDDDRPMPPKRDLRDRHEGHPPMFIGEHDIVTLVVLILMLGANLGIKLYFKQRNDEKTLAELEKQNLEQQLEYLKYQINPHFLMNTLNNIHALVDIDPEKAKTTIVELSKMMRFMLYEGNKQLVPLNREMEFLDTYIELMNLRYTDKVRITVNTPPLRAEPSSWTARTTTTCTSVAATAAFHKRTTSTEA